MEAIYNINKQYVSSLTEENPTMQEQEQELRIISAREWYITDTESVKKKKMMTNMHIKHLSLPVIQKR